MTKRTFVPFQDRAGFTKTPTYTPPTDTFTLTVKPAADLDIKRAKHELTHLVEGAAKVDAKQDGTFNVYGRARESIPVWSKLIERPDLIDSVNGVPASARRPAATKAKATAQHAL